MKHHVGQIIIYEGRKCKIIELTDTTAKLQNLSLVNDKDWKYLEVVIKSITSHKEGTENE